MRQIMRHFLLTYLRVASEQNGAELELHRFFFASSRVANEQNGAEVGFPTLTKPSQGMVDHGSRRLLAEQGRRLGGKGGGGRGPGRGGGEPGRGRGNRGGGQEEGKLNHVSTLRIYTRILYHISM